MEMIEVTANSVDAAIKKGLAELKASPGDVLVEVLEEPNTGLFGFGAREARVRMVLIGKRRAPEPDTIDDVQDESGGRLTDDNLKDVPEEELGEDAKVGKQVLEELLEKMQVDGQIHVYLADEEDDGEDPHWMLNITGNAVNRLIGRRGETLSSLQYVVRLICSRRLQRRANIIIDAGGYKMGRSNRLRGLANRMAKQAVQQGERSRWNQCTPTSAASST